MIVNLSYFNWYRMCSFLVSVLVGVGVNVAVAATVALDGLEVSNEAMMVVVEAMQRMLSCCLSGASCTSEPWVFQTLTFREKILWNEG